MRSIRRHLTASLLVAGVAALGTGGVIVHQRVADALRGQFNAALTARVQALGLLLERDGPYVEFNYVDGTVPQYEPGPEAEYFALWLDWLPTDAPAMRSASLCEASLPLRSGPRDAPAFWDLELPDGRAGRAVGLDVALADVVSDDDDDLDADDADDDEVVGTADADAAGDGPRLTFVVAVSRGPLDESLAALRGGLGFAGAAALVLVLGGGALALRRGLRPLDTLTGQVAAIDAGSLSRRVESVGVPVELSPFTAKLNELLGRLEESFAKERRMTAAMAHELRTPIAELRSAADVARRWPDDPSLAREAVAAAGEVSERMTSTVDAVMRYCRLVVGQAEAEREPVPLRELVDELWRPLAKDADERGLALRNEVDRGVVLVSDRGLLSIVLRNLLGNAVSFADAGPVRVWTHQDDAVLTVHVANATETLQPADVDHLAEPFWRKDAARADAAHSGLGLSLVASVSELLGGSTHFTLAGGELLAAVALPRSGPSGGPGGGPAGPSAASSGRGSAARRGRSSSRNPRSGGGGIG